MAQPFKRIFILLAVTFFTSAAAAHWTCFPAAELKRALERDLGQRRVAGAAVAGGARLERYENPRADTWTLLILEGDRACIAAAGRRWRTLARRGGRA